MTTSTFQNKDLNQKDTMWYIVQSTSDGWLLSLQQAGYLVQEPGSLNRNKANGLYNYNLYSLLFIPILVIQPSLATIQTSLQKGYNFIKYVPTLTNQCVVEQFPFPAGRIARLFVLQCWSNSLNARCFAIWQIAVGKGAGLTRSKI